MYKLNYSTKFKKDLKRYKNNQSDLSAIVEVLKLLERGGVDGIPRWMKPHYLKGEYNNYLECHIKPDLLIIWFQFNEDKTITLTRVGTHSELFK